MTQDGESGRYYNMDFSSIFAGLAQPEFVESFKMVIGLVIVLGCLIFGVRYGGLGLAVVAGIGLVALTFGLHLAPGKPPIDVMLTILAVVTCSGFLQTSRGLDVMLKYAEKLLRRNPKWVTILAPITTWLLTVLCGTGHVVYTMFPIIYDIAIKQGIRPERPMACASVASQMGICASPASVAVVSIVTMLAVPEADMHPTVLQVLSVSVVATFCGVLAAAVWSVFRGKDLDKDPEFQKKIADPAQRAYIYGEDGETQASLANEQLPRSAYRATFIFLAGIAVIALLGNFSALLPHFPDAKGALKPMSMTLTIQIAMLLVAAFIMICCKVKAGQVTGSTVFKAGMVAVISVYGVAWMAETYFQAYLPQVKSGLGALITTYPWTYAIAAFIISKLVNSQAAALAIVVPMALSIGVPTLTIISFISASYGYFVLPTYPSDLACIGFDRSGTTRIGKYVINHSFIIPGFIGIGVGCCVGYAVAHAIL